MNARNRIFIILGILFVIALCWYFLSTSRSGDLQLIGTVDANEVVVSSRIPGRIQTLNVDEGDDVQAGQLIATIQSDDLAAAQRAAEATAVSEHFKLQGASDTERQTREACPARSPMPKRSSAVRRPPWCRRRPSTSIRTPIPRVP